MSSRTIDNTDAKIRFFLPLVKGRRVLDLGVVQHQRDRFYRDTWLHHAIQSESAEVVGVDVDKEGVEYLTSKGYDVRLGDVQDLNLNRKFDVVVAGDIIEHLTNLDGFLDSAKHHLEDTGVLALSTPNPFWWRTWVMVAIRGHACPHPEHTCWFCEKTLQQLLSRKGFEVVRVHYGTVYDMSRWTQRLTKWLNILLPLPARFRHNTLMVVAKTDSSTP